MKRTKIVIAAGGSGGHIFPAIALARSLAKTSHNPEIVFVGTDTAIDRRIFEREGHRFYLLPVNKLSYRLSPRLVVFAGKFFAGIVRAFVMMVRERPDVVVGFGGYVSAPPLLAAYVLRIPRVVHEQNVLPGRANKLFFRLADTVAVSFKETFRHIPAARHKAVFTGNPIRAGEFTNDRPAGAAALGIDKEKFTVLVVGGSQGARFLNETFVDAVAGLRSDMQIIHITGVKDYAWVAEAYAKANVPHRVYSFLDRIEEAYSAADLVVTRSGASAVFELAFFGKPMILVPYPFANGHQVENAKVFSRSGAAVTFEERSLSSDLVRQTIKNFIDDREKLRAMGEHARRLSVPESSELLANIILGRAKGNYAAR